MLADRAEGEDGDVAERPDDQDGCEGEDGEEWRVGRKGPVGDRLPPLLRKETGKSEGGDGQTEAADHHGQGGGEVVEEAVRAQARPPRELLRLGKDRRRADGPRLRRDGSAWPSVSNGGV